MNVLLHENMSTVGPHQFHLSYFTNFSLFQYQSHILWFCPSVIYYQFKLLLFWIIFCFSCGFKIPGFNSRKCTSKPMSFYSRGLFHEGPKKFLNPWNCSKYLKPYSADDDYRAVSLFPSYNKFQVYVTFCFWIQIN